ncbi:MAG TPA: energy transducer TonB [Parvularculaceae bacterium]|nr:energy transducer TonB [Parvularculaceae bacterium]
MAGRVLLSVFLSVLFIAAASAATATYKAEFDQYVRALDKGDDRAAAEHGKAAWLAAEKELGDNGVTAILAYNYGKLVIFNNPTEAQGALKRAKQLQDAGVADLPTSELAVYLAFDDFAMRDDRIDTADAMRKTLLAARKTDEEQPPEYGLMWLRLANADLRGERYEKARASAAEAEKLLNLPNLYRQKAIAIMVGGAARLLPVPRKVADVEAAHNEFLRAIALFPPQKDLDSFDPTFAQALAWNTTALAALKDLGGRDFDHANDSPCKEDDCKSFVNEKTLKECGLEWDQYHPPDYPRKPQQKGYIGAAILGYHLGDDLAVHDARILAEVPQNMFGGAVLAAAKQWTLKAPPPDKLECRQFITPVAFTFK